MAASRPSVYLSESTAKKLEALRDRWGGVERLDRSSAISLAIRRAFEAEGLTIGPEGTAPAEPHPVVVITSAGKGTLSAQIVRPTPKRKARPS